MAAKKVLLVFGTRPEAIKLAPVLAALKRRRGIAPRVCVTAQHRLILDQMLAEFGIRPDHDLGLMRENQSPGEMFQRCLEGLHPVLLKEKPALVMVQGDTTTAAAAALCAFHHRIPVAHVEAGLRSFDLENPFPEEANRILVDRLASLHLAPTRTAKQNLLAEGIEQAGIFVTGNTGVDALQAILRRNDFNRAAVSLPSQAEGRRLILLTLHRRESFGAPLRGIFRAVLELARRHERAFFVYPVHPNPQVKRPALEILRHPRIHLCPPLPYPALLALLSRCVFLMTDSGGLQEEAPGLRKPVLVLRQATERPELISGRAGILAGTDPKNILRQAGRLLEDPAYRRGLSRGINPFGDGKAAGRIAGAVCWHLGSAYRPRDWKG